MASVVIDEGVSDGVAGTSGNCVSCVEGVEGASDRGAKGHLGASGEAVGVGWGGLGTEENARKG